MDANTHLVDSYEKLRAQMEGEGGGGFADIYWCGNPACETKIREETRATCRAIPLNQSHPPGTCVVCGEAPRSARSSRKRIERESSPMRWLTSAA